jgi:hypothetical protein
MTIDTRTSLRRSWDRARLLAARERLAPIYRKLARKALRPVRKAKV